MITPANDLENRTALITGAAKRIGRALARSLAHSGANVVIHANTSTTEAEETALEAREAGASAWVVSGDLGRPDQAAEVLKSATKIAGGIDILVNSASTFPQDTWESATLATFSANLQVNALAPFALMRAFGATVNTGDIINVLDTRILGHDATHFSYHASKRLLHTLTQFAALELAPEIRVNAIAPGLILPPPGENMSFLKEKAETIPLKRYGCEQDVVRSLHYLLASPFVTGQVLYVDGGQHLQESPYA